MRRLPGACRARPRRRRARSSPAASARRRTAARSTRRRTPGGGAPATSAATSRDRRQHLRGELVAPGRDTQPRREHANRLGHLAERAGIEREHLGRRPGTPTRARRSRPRRPHRGPGSRSDPARAPRSARRRPCRASGRRAPRRAPPRRSRGSTARRVDARRGHDRLADHLRRPAAFLRHADERVDQPEVGDDLGRARKERADPHAADDSLDKPLPDLPVVRLVPGGEGRPTYSAATRRSTRSTPSNRSSPVRAMNPRGRDTAAPHGSSTGPVLTS